MYRKCGIETVGVTVEFVRLQGGIITLGVEWYLALIVAASAIVAACAWAVDRHHQSRYRGSAWRQLSDRQRYEFLQSSRNA